MLGKLNIAISAWWQDVDYRRKINASCQIDHPVADGARVSLRISAHCACLLLDTTAEPTEARSVSEILPNLSYWRQSYSEQRNGQSKQAQGTGCHETVRA